MSSQSVQLVKGQMIMLVMVLGFMMLGMFSMVYVSTTFGWLLGLFVGVVELISIGGGFFGFYYAAVLIPVSQGQNLSIQFWETPEKVRGEWVVNQEPLTEIPMDPDERVLPVRIPFGKYIRKTSITNNDGQAPKGLEMIEEIQVTCPDPKCQYHTVKFRVDYAEIFNKIPELTFETHAYVMTPTNASFKQAVLISLCKIDELRDIQDLIFFKGFPAMASTKFISASRLFEMDQHVPVFGAPLYVISFSSKHVELAQQLAGFTPAFMVPTLEKVVQVYNLWGVREALRLMQQNATLQAQVDSLTGAQIDFNKATEATAANINKQETLMDLTPKRIGTGFLQGKYIALMAAIGISAAIITYLLLYVIK